MEKHEPSKNRREVNFAIAARKLRERQGISQHDAAHRLGISVVHLNRIEMGKAKPSIELCQRFEDAMNGDLYVWGWLMANGSPRNLSVGDSLIAALKNLK